MTKKAWGIFAGIIIIILGICFFASGSGSSRPPAALVSSAVSVTVTPLAPSVFLSLSAGKPESQISASTSASVGSVVRTSAQGRALIEGLSHSMVLDYGSQITIRDEGSGHAYGELSFGSVWSRIQKVFEKGEFYEIKTANAVAAVRGTSFGVTYKNGKTSVFVTDGSIVLTPRNAKTGQEDASSSVLVTSGNKAARDGDTKASVLPITAEDRSSEWYRMNVSGTAVLVEPVSAPVPKVDPKSATLIVPKVLPLAIPVKTEAPATTTAATSTSVCLANHCRGQVFGMVQDECLRHCGSG